MPKQTWPRVVAQRPYLLKLSDAPAEVVQVGGRHHRPMRLAGFRVRLQHIHQESLHVISDRSQHSVGKPGETSYSRTAWTEKG